MKNEKLKLSDELAIEKNERQRLMNEKLEAERNFNKEKE